MRRVNRVLLSLAAVLALLSIARIFGGTDGDTALKIEAVRASQVHSIRISNPESSVHITRDGTEWMVFAPTKVRANQQRVDALLSDWSGGMVAESALSTISDEDREQRSGLDPKHRRRLTIEDKSGPLLDLEIGKRVRGGSHYVRVTGSNEVFLARLPAEARLGTDLALWAL